MAQGLPGCTDLAGDPCRGHRAGDLSWFVAAADVCGRIALDVRGMAGGLFRADPASRGGGGCARPSPELAHGLHESNIPLRLLEHELSRGAPHLSDGALSRTAEAARHHAAGPAAALRQHDRGVWRDRPHADPSAEGPDLDDQARPAWLGQALPAEFAFESGVDTG